MSCSLLFKGLEHPTDPCSYPLLLPTTNWNKERTRMDAASSFYDEFYLYYGIQVPPLQTVPPSLPPRPGASSLGPPPPIPFHSRPFSSAQLLSDSAPALQSRNPFRTSPLAVPVPPFDPLPTNPFLRMAPPTGNSAESPATSSTGISDFDLTSPVPLEGRVPPFPNPFAGAALR